MAEPTPEELEDAMDRIAAVRMDLMSSKLKLDATLLRASVSFRQFARALRAVGAADFAEFCEHPDVIELDVVAASWYPEMESR